MSEIHSHNEMRSIIVLGTVVGAIILIVGLVVAYKLPMLKTTTNTKSADSLVNTVVPTMMATATPTANSAQPTTTPTVTEWYTREGNFLRYELGTSSIVSVPVVFMMVKDYTLTGTLLGQSCVQQKIHNGNDYKGTVGNFSLEFKQSCTVALSNGKLPAGWVDIGQILHLTDDGSEIHFIRIAGSKANTYKYVQVTTKAGKKISTGDVYNDYSLIYPNNNIGDANSAVLVTSIQLVINPKDAAEKTAFLKNADKMVLSVHVSK